MEVNQSAARLGYHHGNLRSALIEAGLDALAAGGTRALSLRLLAREVGVTANAAYRHFENKDDLLDAMAAEGFRCFAADQAQAVEALEDKGERLRALGKAYIAFARQRPALFRLMFNRIAVNVKHEELAQASVQALSWLLSASSQVIRAPVSDERTVVAAAACWGMVHGLSDLALGGQLAALGMDIDVLIERVMALPSMLAAQSQV